ncbi:hypothetical protein C4B68_12635 [Streptomyces dengpaensis]|uniref:MurNAc-LAA domain-containing protein n=1 Tax=Streptomyces dengpaensis TaxID=2049881 RepID=A0ABM6SPR2_9ACTN|nr:hypothetical protein C4B68_12635 [Streptomyces dengpaensis]
MADDSLALIVPKPLGAADTLLEAGEEPTDLSPHAARRTPHAARRTPGCTAGPASTLIRTERPRLSGEGCRPAPRVTPSGRPGAGGARKERKPIFCDVGHGAPPINRRA